MSAPPFLDARAVAELLPPAKAVDALEAALRAGLDPEADPPRSAVAARAGELLVMPSTASGAVGVKLASVAPGNPARGLPRIGGIYVLLDPETLAVAALIDGPALTALRTAAVSALAVRHLAEPAPRRLLVFGRGPQGRAHVEAMRAVRPTLEEVEVAGRGDAPDVGRADVICCCTTARSPLFAGGAVAGDATVVAVGSHEPDAREVDEDLVRRSTVVVEARSSALREAGDVIEAIRLGALEERELHGLGALVRGEVLLPAGRPRLFKSTGMAWEDAVVAAALSARAD